MTAPIATRDRDRDRGRGRAKKVDSNGSGKTRWKRRAIVASVIATVALVISIPFVVPGLLARMEYFRLRQVEFEGVQYIAPSELRALIPADSTWSVWQPLDTIAASVEQHPLVAGASIERKFPGTAIVRITERTPIAQVQMSRGRLVPMSSDGRELPIEALRVPLDLPVVLSPDTAILHILELLHKDTPDFYSKVVAARRVASDHVLFDLQHVAIRTRDDVTPARFMDILPVEADLARNGLRVLEFDLRFQNQVIARQP